MSEYGSADTGEFFIMKKWVSCKKFTVFVEIDKENIIIDTAPVTRKFIGQPFNNLKHWFSKFGEYKEADL